MGMMRPERISGKIESIPIRAEHVSGPYFEAHQRAEHLHNQLNQLGPFGTPLLEDTARRLVRRTERRNSTEIIRPWQVRSARDSAEDLGRQLASAAGEADGPTRERLTRACQESRDLARLLDSMQPHDVARPAREKPSQSSQRPSFAVRDPVSGRLVARVAPKPFSAMLEAPATLEAAAPSHSGVRVPVLARFFPAHTVHARRSTAVVTADHCQLTSKDHYHVHRVSVSLEKLLQPGSAGNTALRELLKDPTSEAISRFQRSMVHIATPQERRDTRASLPVQARHRAFVSSAAVVQQGDHSRMTSTTHYMIEESVLPVTELLAHNRHLVRSLVAAATESERGPCTSRFLRAAARSAGCAEELVVLNYGKNIRERDTSIYSLFGVDVVDRAAAVMVGTHNQLRTRMEVQRCGLGASRVLGDLEQVRKQAAQVREARAGKTQLPQRPGIEPGDMTRAAIQGLNSLTMAPRRQERSNLALTSWQKWVLAREASRGRGIERGLG
jgi:hypothetical protein